MAWTHRKGGWRASAGPDIEPNFRRFRRLKTTGPGRDIRVRPVVSPASSQQSGCLPVEIPAEHSIGELGQTDHAWAGNLPVVGGVAHHGDPSGTSDLVDVVGSIIEVDVTAREALSLLEKQIVSFDAMASKPACEVAASGTVP